MAQDETYQIRQLASVINDISNVDDVYRFLKELFTNAELSDLSKRWRILTMLNDGYTQRKIAQELKVSLCKVTRGAKIIKNKKSVTSTYLNKNIK